MSTVRRTEVAGLRSYDKRTKIAKFDCYLPGSRSERRRRTVQCESYQNALEKLKEFKEELVHEAKSEATQPAVSQPTTTDVETKAVIPTFGEYVTEFWPSITGRESETTKERNSILMKEHIRPFFASKRLDQIKAIDADDFVLAMQAKRKANGAPYSPASINTCLRLFKTVMSNAVKRELIPRVPYVTFLPEPDVANEFDDAEWSRFLHAFDDREAFLKQYEGPRVRGCTSPEMAEIHYQSFRDSKPIFALELSTGLRRSDLIHTEWTHLVQQDGHTFLKRVNSKTGKVVLVPLTPEAEAGIEECRRRPMRSTRWVFVQRDGSCFSLTTLLRHFARAKKLAGITRKVRFHDLRHSVGCRLVSRGVDISIVRDVLGHASIVTTQRYARASSKARQAITAALSVQGDERNVEHADNRTHEL